MNTAPGYKAFVILGLLGVVGATIGTAVATADDPGSKTPLYVGVGAVAVYMVLLMLYPIVFLFGYFVGSPLLDRELQLPFAVSLFLGNIVSVFLTGFLVPWIAGHFGWWLRPAPGREARINLMGAALIAVVYAAMVFLFLRLF